MTEEAVNPLPAAFPEPQEPPDPLYDFTYDNWLPLPIPPDENWFTSEELARRHAHAASYRHIGNTTSWNRYLQLGLFVVEDCAAFDKMWEQRHADPLTIHRAIWYQFMKYIDYEWPIPTKLNEWAMNVSRAYLEYHSPSSLQVIPAAKWTDQTYETPMDIEESDDTGWTPVQSRRSRNNSHPKTTGATSSSSPTISTTMSTPRMMHELSQEKHQTNPNVSTMMKQWLNSKKATKSNSRSIIPTTSNDPIPAQTAPVEIPVTLRTTNASGTAGSIENNSHGSGRTSSFPTIAVNDGTHRVTIKWKPPDEVQSYEKDQEKLSSAIGDLMKALFADSDGMIYPWQSDDTSGSDYVSNLTGDQLRALVTPNVTYIRSSSLLIFGVRYGFTDNPITWQSASSTKENFQKSNVSVLISNSKSTSGKIVTAGYILLKSSNSTSTHRYTQFLRSKLPDASPFFDITRFKRTPMDQSIPHLAIQCGESHVTTLCQALSTVLKGKGMALFLPRYAFSAMSTDQITTHFAHHDAWAKSLISINLSPLVFHLDQSRIEYFPDGSTIERSTREWASTLCLPNGKSALCDVVNGTKDRKALLLVPKHYADLARAELRQYKNRLSPLGRREERFRQNLTDLPEVIHIQQVIQSSVASMESMFSDEVWQSLPSQYPSVNNSPTNRQQKLSEASTTTISNPPILSPRNSWQKPPSILRRAGTPSRPNRIQFSDDISTTSDQTYITPGDQSTSSTQGTTVISEPSHDQLRLLEQRTQQQLASMRTQSNDTTTRLQNLEIQFTKFDTLESTLNIVKADMASLAGHVEQSMETQQSITTNLQVIQTNSMQQFSRLDDHLITTATNVTDLSSVVKDMQKEFVRMSTLMQDLTNRHFNQISVSNSASTSLQKAANLPRIDEAQAQSLPDSSDNSVVSTTSAHSKASASSAHSAVTVESTESTTTLRSPPPKRTRQGVVLETDDPMNIDPRDVESESEEHSQHNHDFGSGDDGTICRNLEGNFNDLQDFPLTQPMQNDSENTSTPSDGPLSLAQPLSPTAPLDCHYNLSNDPAGAVSP